MKFEMSFFRLVAGFSLTMVIPLIALSTEVSGGDFIPMMLETSEGVIEIGLDPAAAPEAVHFLARLVKGPIFSEGFRSREAPPESYYEGLSFDFAIPGHVISTEIRSPARSILIPTEIDAKALGLDGKFMGSSGEAMDRWQFEIMRAMTRIKGRPDEGTALGRWLALWEQKGNADFLLRMSEKEINEGLGWSYRENLQSIPIRRGVVSLKPFDRKQSTPGLVIYLVDRPDLDGRQMGVGRVLKGLDLCDSISRRPLSPAKAEQFRPLAPVRIFKAVVDAGAEGCSGDIESAQSKGGKQ